MYGTTCPYLPFGCQPSRQCVVSMRRTSRLFLMYTARPARRVVGFMRYESYGKAIDPPARRCRSVGKTLQYAFPGRLPMAICSQDAFPRRPTVAGLRLMRSWPDWQWQYTRAMRSRVPCRDKIPPRCVPECLAVARFHHGAFPGACRWQNAREMRSRAAIRGKFCASCIPKVASDGKIASSRQDSRAMHPKTGWLWQDMRAMHPKRPANCRWRMHRGEDLAGRGPFRCTGPSNHA